MSIETEEAGTPWWTLNIENKRELTETDKEHIAHLISEGFTEGALEPAERYTRGEGR